MRKYLAKAGSKGGKAGTGSAKARPKTARKAAFARWKNKIKLKR